MGEWFAVAAARVVQPALPEGLQEMIGDLALLHGLGLDQHQPIGLEVVDREQVRDVLVGQQAEQDTHARDLRSG